MLTITLILIITATCSHITDDNKNSVCIYIEHIDNGNTKSLAISRETTKRANRGNIRGREGNEEMQEEGKQLEGRKEGRKGGRECTMERRRKEEGCEREGRKEKEKGVYYGREG